MNDILLDMEKKIIDDNDGKYREEIQTKLNKYANEIKNKLNKGVNREDYNKLFKTHEAIKSSLDVLTFCYKNRDKK